MLLLFSDTSSKRCRTTSSSDKHPTLVKMLQGNGNTASPCSPGQTSDISIKSDVSPEGSPLNQDMFALVGASVHRTNSLTMVELSEQECVQMSHCLTRGSNTNPLSQAYRDGFQQQNNCLFERANDWSGVPVGGMQSHNGNVFVCIEPMENGNLPNVPGQMELTINSSNQLIPTCSQGMRQEVSVSDVQTSPDVENLCKLFQGLSQVDRTTCLKMFQDLLLSSGFVVPQSMTSSGSGTYSASSMPDLR